MSKLEKRTAPLGMVGVVAYVVHVFVGQLLWEEYNPITTDISSLTAVDAPNREQLVFFTAIYGIAMLLFVSGMIVKSIRKYHSAVRVGWVILLIMNLVCMFGYSMFPLSGDKAQMTFGNLMHIAVTVVVVFTTISAGFFLAVGYLRQERMKALGVFTLVMAVIITATGALNPIGMVNNLNIMGLTERAVIFSLQAMMFVFSAYYTFSPKERTMAF